MVFSKIKVVLATSIIVIGMQTVDAQLNINTATTNIYSNTITFRTPSTARMTSTTFYGNLRLSGGDAGTQYGLLYCNAVWCAGPIAGTTASFSSRVQVGSDLAVQGKITVKGLEVFSGKNFVQLHPTDSTKVIKYVSIEAGEALTLARGTIKTNKGEATILLPEDYVLVTSPDKPISTILTPKNVPAVLYVSSEDRKKIVVKIKNSDYFEFGDVSFNYLVTGVRDCFEDNEPIQDVDDSKVAKKAVSEKKQAYDKKLDKFFAKQNEKMEAKK